MPTRVSRTSAAVSALVAILLTTMPSIASACAACGCGDVAVSSMGIPDTDKGGTVVGIQASDKSDVIGGETTNDARAQAVVIYSALPNLQLNVVAPYVNHGIGNKSVSALGDIDVGATVAVWRQSGLSAGQSFMLRAGVTLPTGQHEGRNLDLMTGFGATSTTLGAAWFGHLKAWRFYSSAS
ncbi:MAG TPA: transporter, partial [bacterium]|nr:transporter [bacterium]